MKVQTGDETLKHGAAANPAATCIQGRFIQRHAEATASTPAPFTPSEAAQQPPFLLGAPFKSVLQVGL